MRFREINRWHVIGALLLPIPIAFVLWGALTSVCGTGELGHMRCGWEETWLWVTSGGDWKLWSFVGLYVTVIVGALLGPDESEAKNGQDQRN